MFADKLEEFRSSPTAFFKTQSPFLLIKAYNFTRYEQYKLSNNYRGYEHI